MVITRKTSELASRARVVKVVKLLPWASDGKDRSSNRCLQRIVAAIRKKPRNAVRPATGGRGRPDYELLHAAQVIGVEERVASGERDGSQSWWALFSVEVVWAKD
jgi:hypothetical protein